MRTQRPTAVDGKILIVIRIAPRVLAGLRRAAARRHKSLQTYIHDVLEKAVSKRGA
jgi:predicted HicB family RNase H-like nuclease